MTRTVRFFAVVFAVAVSIVCLHDSLSARDDPSNSVSLFNGKDLVGWTPYLGDRRAQKEDRATPASEVWSVQDLVRIPKIGEGLFHFVLAGLIGTPSIAQHDQVNETRGK